MNAAMHSGLFILTKTASNGTKDTPGNVYGNREILSGITARINPPLFCYTAPDNQHKVKKKFVILEKNNQYENLSNHKENKCKPTYRV